ncbi:XRE family transcriptional regulator [Lonsdalea quercina]|uniref:transcriptional regulator n=1 Tax=Lonsdalea quercina TaxID=71657 RepID=UPI0009076EC1|nr:transcriptional regulator [Lonsdalea quercina]
MRLIKEYSPPTTDDLLRLKKQLSHTGNQMADLAGVASNSQWRKYTGGESPRTLSLHILFYIAAQLSLSDQQINIVVNKMREMGAEINSAN